MSGLRGAGDASGDGKSNARGYQFVKIMKNTTKNQTTLGGAQHLSRDMNLTGTGDVVITDIRNTTAGLILMKKWKVVCLFVTIKNRLVVNQRSRKIFVN